MNKDNVRKSKGQALVLVALSFVVLLAFVGLAVDVGQLFIYMGHLRRAVDAASLAAAAQYREMRSVDEMTAAAAQVMNLNGIDPSEFVINVETCETNPGDSQLCTTPKRKLVRVTGQLRVPMSFLAIIGIQDITITANSIGEAASLDVVLVIDISESMAWDAPMGDPMRDPYQCNHADPGGADGYKGECQPFEEVKKAATSFINRILNKPPGEEEDRLAIVTFATGWDPDPNRGTFIRTPGWTSDRDVALAIIRDLVIYEPGRCWIDELNQIPDTFYGSCRDYNDEVNPPEYEGFDCLSCLYTDPSAPPVGGPNLDPFDFSASNSTNIGGGLLRAGNMFALETREDALWVVVLLTDGMANTTDVVSGDDITDYTTYPIGYCPNAEDPSLPRCQDKDVTTRHHSGDSAYDADDYARDMADFVGCYPPPLTASACGNVTGQGAVIFTIGLGDEVLRLDNNGRPYGATLLRYIAAVGYDGDPATDPCEGVTDYTAWCGNYYFSPTGPGLTRIFEDIASRIFTRITH